MGWVLQIKFRDTVLWHGIYFHTMTAPPHDPSGMVSVAPTTPPSSCRWLPKGQFS